MGVVYRARQTALRREVAIKTLRPDQAGAAPEKFVAEALVTGVLDHLTTPSRSDDAQDETVG